jgi:hypothetical protein
MTFSSGSSCTNAVEIAGHYALAALGQRIGAAQDESSLAVPVSRSDIGAG